MKEKRSKHEIQGENMKNMIRFIDDGEMTREKFDAMKDLPVALRETVGELIEASVDIGSLKWTKDKSLLMLTKYIEINLDLDAEVAESLRKKVQETKKNPETLIVELIRENL